MVVSELISAFRRDAGDAVKPYFFTDKDVIAWLNEAEDEACERARLIFDGTNQAICKLPFNAGARFARLHPSILEVVDAKWVTADTGATQALRLTSRMHEETSGAFGRNSSDTGLPVLALHDEGMLSLWPVPNVSGYVWLQCYRRPLLPLLPVDTEERSPEIHAAHHKYLVQYVLHRAFAVPDADAFDPSRSEKALKIFERRFGLGSMATVARRSRADQPRVNPAFTW